MYDRVPLGPPALANDLETAVDVLRAVEAHLAAEAMDRRSPSISGWTVGQQLVHIGLVAGSIATALKVLIRRGGAEEKSSPAAREMLVAGTIPRGVATAPAGLSSPTSPPPEEIRSAHAKATRKWADLAGQGGELKAIPGTLPHPLLGPLEASEWVRFAALHGRHHLEIVEEILADGTEG